jgi:hypothetical protein
VSAGRGRLKAKVQAWRTVHRGGKTYAQRFVTSKGSNASTAAHHAAAPPQAVANAKKALADARRASTAGVKLATADARRRVSLERKQGMAVIKAARTERNVHRKVASAATAEVRAKRAELQKRVKEHKAAHKAQLPGSTAAGHRKALHARVKQAQAELGIAQGTLKTATGQRRQAHAALLAAVKAKAVRVKAAQLAGKPDIANARATGAANVKAAQAALAQAKTDAKRAALRKRLGVSGGGASPPIAPTPAPRPAPTPPPAPKFPPRASRPPEAVISRMKFPDPTGDGVAVMGAAHTLAGYIDMIHAVPATMPEMKMVSFAYLARRPASEVGAYKKANPRVRGVYMNALGIVATRANIGVPEGQVRAVMAHEVGHALDYAINPCVAYRAAPPPHALPEAHRNWAAREKLLREIHATPEVAAMKARHKAIEFNTDSQSRSEAEHLRYLTSDVELFARAYAQHVEMHAGDRDMRLHHDSQTTPGIAGHPAAHNAQWQPMTFAPVRAAFNDFFHEVGLAPSPHP